MKENLKKQYLKMIKEIDEILPVYDYIWEWDKEDWFKHIVLESSNYKGCDLNKLIENKILLVMLSDMKSFFNKNAKHIINFNPNPLPLPKNYILADDIKFTCKIYFQYKYFRKVLLNYFERGTLLC